MNQADNNNQADVFVLVPSYNHAPFIEKCLKSIFKQTLAPKKLLVIDDGSRDDSPQIIERILKESPFDCELIARENRGLCATLNQGLSLSTEEFFAYIGSDDIWLPSFLEERAKLLSKRKNAVLGYGHALFINEKDEIYDCSTDYKEIWANYPDGDMREALLQGIAPISSTVFYRRSLLEKTAWNEKAKLEDYEMYLKLSAIGEFAFDPQVLSAWRQHSYNTSRHKMLMLQEVIEAQNRNVTALNVTREDLKSAQTKTKFRYARELLQNGNKKDAVNLAKESWRGANSMGELLKFGLRLLVPMKIINLKRKYKKEKNFQRRQHLLSI